MRFGKEKIDAAIRATEGLTQAERAAVALGLAARMLLDVGNDVLNVRSNGESGVMIVAARGQACRWLEVAQIAMREVALEQGSRITDTGAFVNPDGSVRPWEPDDHLPRP